MLGNDLDARVRFWWADLQGVLGLILAFVFTAILGLVMFVPTGPTTIVTGKIERFGLAESRTGSYPVARVRLPDREVTVALPRSNTCALRGPITLQQQERVWGQRFIAAWTGCGRGF
jgi:uncharacterized iron-regulated membrane protein